MGGDWVESPGALAIAIICAVVALALSVYNIFKHAVHFNSPRTQKYIFRILGVIPVYAICSCVSVIAPSAAVVVLTLRDVYEAFVVYSFFTLILEYAGGDYNCTEQIKHLPPVRHPPPLCCLPAVRRDAHLLRMTKQGVVQFVVVKPVMALLSLAALAGGLYFEPAFQAVLLIVYNITYSMALYCLLLFYLAIQTLLTPFQPVQKFFAVKAIVFATFWQSMLVYLLPGLTAEQALLWNNFLLCVECVPFALLLNHAFPFHDFMTNTADKRVADSMRTMLNVGDVFQDAYHSFMPSYQDYVVARDDHDNPLQQPKTFRARTFLVGNLDSEAMRGAPAAVEGGAQGEGGEGDSAPGAQHGSGGGASAQGGGGGTRALRAGGHGDNDPLSRRESGGDGLGLDDMWSAADVDIIELSGHRAAGLSGPNGIKSFNI